MVHQGWSLSLFCFPKYCFILYSRIFIHNLLTTNKSSLIPRIVSFEHQLSVVVRWRRRRPPVCPPSHLSLDSFCHHIILSKGAMSHDSIRFQVKERGLYTTLHTGVPSIIYCLTFVGIPSLAQLTTRRTGTLRYNTPKNSSSSAQVVLLLLNLFLLLLLLLLPPSPLVYQGNVQIFSCS